MKPETKTNTDTWNPEQYNKFKNQRSTPFWDLLDLVQPQHTPGEIKEVVDLGCGTGELTAAISKRFPQANVLGMDNSTAMLEESKAFATDKLRFENHDLKNFEPKKKFDLIFSNAALQWVSDHETFYPKMLTWVAAKGQVAIQIPYNFDHPSHRIAHEVAQKFPVLANQPRRNQLPQERYTEIFYKAGFQEQKNRIEIYLHPMKSGSEVVEWTKGTLLTSYQKKLSKEDFEKFLSLYSEQLLKEIGTGPYLYAFKRLLIWARNK